MLHTPAAKLEPSSATAAPAATSEITYINDIRNPADFRAVTFSKFKKNDVKKQLFSCITDNTKKVQEACFWSAELLLAGHYNELWEVILHFFGKCIHVGNPKLPIYLEKRFQCFRAIINDDMYISELHTRNSANMRKLFAEIICVLSFSNKKHSYDRLKIDCDEEFDIDNITERLRAPNTSFAADIFRKKDTKECFVAANEFAYSLETQNTQMAFYWVEWFIEFDSICKKRKEPCLAEARHYIPVSSKQQTDVIWIFWDILTNAVEKRESEKNQELIKRIMDSLIQLFCIHYTPGCAKKRRYMFYFAVSILTEKVDFGIEMISNKPMIEVILKNIDNVYKVIKKNEDSPNTDYLYINLEKQNTIEKSIQQMQILEKYSSIPTRGTHGSTVFEAASPP